jgi:hypothetical protein
MTNNNIKKELEGLLNEAAEAHHAAYIEKDGEDSEWPIWYAEYLHSRLGSLLNADFTKSELVYLILLAEKERQLVAPGANWSNSLSKFLLDRYE